MKSRLLAAMLLWVLGCQPSEGRAILEPNLNDKLMMADTMLSAAEKAVELAS